MSFSNLGLSESLLRAVRAEGYEVATPIQVNAIPRVLEGRDLMGCAQTGTGKTAAFALPTLQRLHQLHLQRAEAESGEANTSRRGQRRPIRCLVLAPTRELAVQIATSFKTYGKYTRTAQTVIYGGVGQSPQVRALQAGVDVVVATPGRLLDLMQQGFVDLKQVEILILDEADQMFDMGFLRDLKRIVAAVPKERQTLMFSATMSDEIRAIAKQWLSDPAYVEVARVATPAELVSQSVYMVDARNKPFLLAHYLKTTAGARTLVFSRTKHGADRLVRQLGRSGIRAEAIHGNKSQNARQRVLEQFKSGKAPVLVATDVAARGLDIQGVTHVVNYELPEVPETYVHRIGRTGRAGAEGIAVSFCSGDERSKLRRIEQLMRKTIEIDHKQPAYPAPEPGARSERSHEETETRSARPGSRRRSSSSSSASSGRPATSHGSAGTATREEGGKGRKKRRGPNSSPSPYKGTYATVPRGSASQRKRRRVSNAL